MKHHALTAAMGFLIAAIFVPTGHAQAAAADPTGIWRKAEQGERPGKMQVFRCGRSKTLLCVKIVWLESPLDSRGRPLHDVRNENASMRDRPILGLPIVNGMQPVSPNQWKGSIYNPEDGNTYSATLTLVSRNQIHLKGCKAWLLCGERTWLRTSLPEPEPEPEPLIEASVEPEPAPDPNVLAEAELLTPAVEHGTRPGFRFLNASANAETPSGFAGEDVPSMFAMTSLITPQPAPEPAGAETPSTAAAPASAPAVEAPKPKPRTMQASAAPKPGPTAPAPRAAPAPTDTQDGAIETAETAETENAETAELIDPALSRRQRRMLRRQQKQEGGVLPWTR